MVITAQTPVAIAFTSSAEAPSIFAGHGVRPDVTCRLCWDLVTLDEAAEHCHVQGLPRLIQRLNAAAALEGGPQPR